MPVGTGQGRRGSSLRGGFAAPARYSRRRPRPGLPQVEPPAARLPAMPRRIAVIAGAGPAGLTAAFELLARTDVHPVILEATQAIGGIAQTYSYKGNRIDIGGHRFFSKSDRVMDWWFRMLPLQGRPAADDIEAGHEIEYSAGGMVHRLARAGDRASVRESWRDAPDPEQEDEVLLQRPRLSRIFYRRHFFPYPIGITLSVAWRLGLWNTTRIGLSYCKARLFPLRDETFLDAFFINRFGRRLYETFFRDYTELPEYWRVVVLVESYLSCI